MKKDIIQLPIRFGFHEYFDSQTGQGYGSANFSWTAALFLDLVYEYYEKDEHSFDWLKLGKTSRLKKKKILNYVPESQSSQIESGATKDVASEVMASIGDLKDSFYDLNRGRVDYQAVRISSKYRRYQDIVAKLQG